MTDICTVKIALVDDEPFMLKLLGRMLENLGCAALSGHVGGRAALDAFAAAGPPDLILLDLNMPEMDGIEFVRHLVETRYAGSLILVSGEDERMLQAASKLVRAHQIRVLGHLHGGRAGGVAGAMVAARARPDAGGADGLRRG
jgi:CheY-like chemotaxis protein